MLTETESAAVRYGVFPMDPGFPQLEVASDTARMLEVFRAHLQVAPGRTCRILDCAPFRFRFRQSTSRCVLQYTLRVAEPSTGRQWNQWVTGLLYATPGEAEATARRLRSSQASPPVSEPWRCFEPVTFIPELDMVVEVFPFDGRLPQLGRVLDGGVRTLEPLLLARLGPGRWEATASPTIEPKRYRTELGAVMRCTLPARQAVTGRAEDATCYLKVYRDRRGEETFELLRSWWRRAEKTSPPYTLVRPLAYLRELRTLALEEVPGSSLREVLIADRDPVTTVRSVARACAAFNQDHLDIPRHHSLADQRRSLMNASALVRWARPEKRAKIGGLSAVVAHTFEEAPPATIHRDLTPEHVLVSDNKVTFVDTDSIALGDPVRDPALLFAHIAGMGMPGPLPRDQALAMGHTFVEEYFAHVPSSWRPRFRTHCAAAFLELAADVFRSQGPSWREQVAELASNVRHALAGEFG